MKDENNYFKWTYSGEGQGPFGKRGVGGDYRTERGSAGSESQVRMIMIRAVSFGY
jgi:hypothetical protein